MNLVYCQERAHQHEFASPNGTTFSYLAPSESADEKMVSRVESCPKGEAAGRRLSA